MKKYIQDKFALSDEGADDFMRSVRWSFLLNCSYMLPVMLAFYFIRTTLLNGTTVISGQIAPYLIVALVIVVVMFWIALHQYDATYLNTYTESAKMRISLAEKIRKLPLAFFAKRDIADLSSTIMSDTTKMEELFSHAVPQMFASCFSAFFFVIMLIFFQWQLALAMLWVVPVAFLIFFFSRKLHQRAHKKIHSMALGITDSIQEALDCIAELKSCNYTQKYGTEFNAQLDTYEKEMIHSELTLGALFNVSHFFLKLGLASTALAGAYLFSSGAVDLFTTLVFMIVATSIFNPFLQVLDNMAALLFLSVRIERKKEMDRIPIQEGSETFSPENFDIELRDVSFSYDKDVETLQGISFIAKQGEVTALVGPSGGGKSTTARLAARFWDIDAGSITLGGVELNTIAPETLLHHYSIVFQEVILFNLSVMDNIRIGRKDASDDDVIQAAQMARCEEFIVNLPDGYNTLIGENGTRLSGGERQRISIARAILKDAPIVLLDEATASLDVENESAIQRALSALVKNKTVLIIAHRMRTVLDADQVIVIANGKIIEKGSPQQLLQENGWFSKMNQ